MFFYKKGRETTLLTPVCFPDTTSNMENEKTAAFRQLFSHIMQKTVYGTYGEDFRRVIIPPMAGQMTYNTKRF